MPSRAKGALGLVVEEEEGDVVLLDVAGGGRSGPIRDFGEEIVGKLCGGHMVVGFHVPLDAIKTELLASGVGGFGDAVGVEDMAVTGLQRDFEGGIFGVGNHS